VSVMQAPNTCGCCRPDGSPTPHLIANRPGLASIQYRVGTYGSFLLAMMEGIAHAPELRQTWLTRSTDDFGIVVLAMWAYVADILTFYQERIANEAYLRTAILQESVQRLAALLDYEPAPGSAAEADLAFFVEAGKQVQIPIGLRVQSVPGQNEKPQKFETADAITADGILNQLQIFSRPQTYAPFALGSAQAVLLSSTKGLAAGTKLAIFSPLRAERKAISGLDVHNTQEILSWTPAVQSSDFSTFATQVAVYDKEYHLFGSNTPTSFVQSVADSSAPGGVKLQLVTAPYVNSNLAPPPPNRFTLDARYDDLKPGMTILIAREGSSSNPSDTFARLASVTNITTETAIDGPLQSSVTWLTTGMAVASTPVFAVDTAGKLNSFCIADDGAVWTIRQISSGWSSWQSLGGKVDRLAVGRNADARLEVFARGTNNALWHIAQVSPGGSWGGWESLGGQIDLLAVGSNQDGRMAVFASSPQDKSLSHIAQVSPGGSWNGWDSLGGQIDLLAVTSNQDGRIEVFARGMDRALWHIYQTAPNGNWSSWSSLGGIIDLLAVITNKDGRIEVFARGTDRALWHIRQTAPNNGWSGWTSLGGIIDLLAVNRNQDGRIEVFARGTDRALWHIWQTAPNNGWSSWSSLGGVIELLSVGRNQDGRLEPLVRGTDEALWHIWQTAPNNGWSAWSSLGLPMWSLPVTASGRGRITIYSVTRLLDLSSFEYGDSITGNQIYVPVSAIAGIDTKRNIILDDAASDPQTVLITAALQIDSDGDGEPDHWQISFTPDLDRTLDTSSATLYGNVTASTHGQTISGEVLGNGDSSQTFQSFPLQKSPVTFVHKPGALHGVANTLQIQIGGVYWKEVQDFFAHGPKERIFTTTEDAKGMTVQFGDGVTGSRVPTGKANVVATYRQGIGLVGNVSTGALRTLLDRPVGLKSVTNPAGAAGGSEPEDIDQSRTNAPNTVRTFGRIVSLEDFEDSAREFAGVAKAHASWEWSGEERIVYLTVAGPDGAQIAGATYDELVADLNSRRDTNRALRVRTYKPIPLQVQAAIFVDPDYVSDDVLASAQAALNTYFSFDNLQFGEPIHVSNAYAALQQVAGIVGVDMVTLQYKYPTDAISHGATADALQVHLRINDDELAVIEDTDTDATITLGQVQS
jgi:acylphosphatase/uncharacterized phage protein gp47/JayE